MISRISLASFFVNAPDFILQTQFPPRVDGMLILGNNINISELPFDRTEQLVSRTFHPFAELRGLISVRNGVICVESSEVIDSYNVIQFKAVLYTPKPPLIPCLLMVFPVIKRVTPKLPGG